MEKRLISLRIPEQGFKDLNNKEENLKEVKPISLAAAISLSKNLFSEVKIKEKS